MSSNGKSNEGERAPSIHSSTSPNIEVVTSPMLEKVRVVVEKLVMPPRKSPVKRDKDLRSDTEKAEDLE
jgi:hypothetical protein